MGNWRKFSVEGRKGIHTKRKGVYTKEQGVKSKDNPVHHNILVVEHGRR